MKLHLGCGRKILPGYVNVDYVKAQGVDRVLDLNKHPYPFKTASVQEIIIYHTLEHLDDPMAFLAEASRILRKGGILDIRVPHFSASSAYMPLHKSFYYARWFHCLTGLEKPTLDGTPALFREAHPRVCMVKGWVLWNHILEPLVNSSETALGTYERLFAWIFPSIEIHVQLIK